MRVTECSICRRTAPWLIDTEVLCGVHKELIIVAAGVDRFRIRWLTEAECVFPSGDWISRTMGVKRRRKIPMAKLFELPAERCVCAIPVKDAVFCRDCLMVSNSRLPECSLCGSGKVMRLEGVLNGSPDPPAQAQRPTRFSQVRAIGA